VGIAVGAAAAVVVGLPALRIQGLYLAATTLAFGYAVQEYVLDHQSPVGRLILPAGYGADIVRPRLYGLIDLENGRVFYLVCAALLVLVAAAVGRYQRLRGRRILVAVRDNPRAAAAFGVDVARTRLAAFAISGAVAGLAGALFAYAQHNVAPGSYGVLASIVIFLAVVMGGVTSTRWAAAAAMGLEATVLFGPRFYGVLGHQIADVIPLLLTGPVLILLLMTRPTGIADAAYQARDLVLRLVARRRGLAFAGLAPAARTTELAEVYASVQRQGAL